MGWVCVEGKHAVADRGAAMKEWMVHLDEGKRGGGRGYDSFYGRLDRNEKQNEEKVKDG